MITYEKILKKPQIAAGLIGMSLEEFQTLYAKFEQAHTARVGGIEYTRRNAKMKRRRAVGAGRKYKYALHDRLVMTLFWLRAYTTYKVIGILYDLNKTTVEEDLKSVMQTLSMMACFNFEHPQADIPKLHSVQEVIDAFPDLLLFMDSQEDSRE